MQWNQKTESKKRSEQILNLHLRLNPLITKTIKNENKASKFWEREEYNFYGCHSSIFKGPVFN